MVPGNSKSLQNAVNLARHINPNVIPTHMKLNGVEIEFNMLIDMFAEFFDKKEKTIVESCKVDGNVYYVRQNITCPNLNFITTNNNINALKSIKIKNLRVMIEYHRE